MILSSTSTLYSYAREHESLASQLSIYREPPLGIADAPEYVESLRKVLETKKRVVAVMQFRLGILHKISSRFSSETDSNSATDEASRRRRAEIMRKIKDLQMFISIGRAKIADLQSKIVKMQVLLNRIALLYREAFRASNVDEYPEELRLRYEVRDLMAQNEESLNDLCQSRGVQKLLQSAVDEMGKADEMIQSWDGGRGGCSRNNNNNKCAKKSNLPQMKQMAVTALKERINEARKSLLFAGTLKPDSEVLEDLSERLEMTVMVLDGAARAKSDLKLDSCSEKRMRGQVKSLQTTLQTTLQSTTDHVLCLELYTKDLGEVLRIRRDALGEVRRGIFRGVLFEEVGKTGGKGVDAKGAKGMEEVGGEEKGRESKETSTSNSNSHSQESNLSTDSDPDVDDPPAYVESDSVFRGTSTLSSTLPTLSPSTSASSPSTLNSNLNPFTTTTTTTTDSDRDNSTDLNLSLDLGLDLDMEFDPETASIETRTTLPAYSVRASGSRSGSRLFV